MPELSVIVPIYKVEQYLEICINSILNQEYQDFELVLVDDGSPDRCPEICDRKAAEDKRIRVIHQQNQGLVTARRTGLQAAVGKYIAFVDSDDRICQDYFFRMMKCAQESHAEVVISGYRQGTEEQSEKKRNRIDSGVYTGKNLETFRNRCLYDGVYYQAGIVPAVWNKMILRESILRVLPVNKDIRMGEDAALTYPLIKNAGCVAVDNEIDGYLYRVVQQSMSRKYDPMYFDRIGKLISGLTDQLKDDSGMTRQLDYYVVFVLEVGMRQLITKQNLAHPAKLRNEIARAIRQFDLPQRIARMDLKTVKTEDIRRIRLLQENKPGRYLYSILREAI